MIPNVNFRDPAANFVFIVVGVVNTASTGKESRFKMVATDINSTTSLSLIIHNTSKYNFPSYMLEYILIIDRKL